MEPKVALCFLTYDNLSQPELWKQFQSSKYSIYIHNKNSFTGDFAQYCIGNPVDTKWGDISLVKATLSLFQEAYNSPENKYFVLLSDKCIPLYGPDEMYKRIAEADDNILNAFKTEVGSKWHNMRYNTIADKCFFDESDFYGQSQWMLLKRETVTFFLDNDYTDIFGPLCDVPDETYFVNIMNKFEINFRKRVMTIVNWDEESDLQKYNKLPKTYSNLTNGITQHILESGCLFMRKVGPECILPSYFDTLP